MTVQNCHEIIETIMVALFTAEDRRLTLCIDNLVEANREFFRNQPHDGFMFQGKPYDPSGLLNGMKKTRVTMSFRMVDQMEDYLRDRAQVDGDRKLIAQLLFPLIRPCESTQEIRDALPNCVVDLISDWRGIPRDQAVAFTLVGNDRLYQQFMRILPRIEFYATTRLLY